jgi:hypothetical protein
MAWEREKRAVEENTVALISETVHSQTGDTEITGYWEVVDDDKASSCQAYLNQSTSTLNGSKNRQWVDEPNVRPDESKTGRWRLVRTSLVTDGELAGRPQGIMPQGIIRVLRSGFATALLDDEARFGGVQGSPNDAGFQLTQVWPYVDPQYAMSLSLGSFLTTTTVTDPQAYGLQGKTRAYKFAVGRFNVSLNDDGSARVARPLTRVQNITAVASFTGLTPERIVGRTVTHPFDTSTPAVYVVDTDVDTQDVETLRFRHIDRDDRSVIEGIADDDWEDNLTDSAGTAYSALATPYAFVAVNIHDDPETWTIVVDVTFQLITNVTSDIGGATGYTTRLVGDVTATPVAGFEQVTSRTLIDQGNANAIDVSALDGVGYTVIQRIVQTGRRLFTKMWQRIYRVPHVEYYEKIRPESVNPFIEWHFSNMPSRTDTTSGAAADGLGTTTPSINWLWAKNTGRYYTDTVKRGADGTYSGVIKIPPVNIGFSLPAPPDDISEPDVWWEFRQGETSDEGGNGRVFYVAGLYTTSTSALRTHIAGSLAAPFNDPGWTTIMGVGKWWTGVYPSQGNYWLAVLVEEEPG